MDTIEISDMYYDSPTDPLAYIEDMEALAPQAHAVIETADGRQLKLTEWGDPMSVAAAREALSAARDHLIAETANV